MNTAERLSRYRSENNRLRTALAQRSRELAFFINSGKALTSTLEFNKILRVIMDRAERLIKCDAWSLLLVDDAAHELRIVAARGGKSKGGKKFRLKVGQGIAGWVADSGQPLLIKDVRNDRRFNRAVDPVTRSKTRSVLCVPIVNKKRTIGVLEMINKPGREPFDEKDLDLLQKLVDQAAIALERAMLYERMSNLAVTDDLTKLFNFRYMDEIMDHEIKRCQRYGSTLSIIFFDMDYFKHVNDTHGHLMGSKVLVEVAHILVENLRNVDIIARYGGDEFIVALPETNVETALRITQRLHRNMKAHEFLKEEGLRIRMSASFGIAGYPDHAMSKRDLVRMADQAMYQAKNSGRDQICLAEKRSDRARARAH